MGRDKDEMRHKKDIHPRVKEGLIVSKETLWSCVSRRVQQGKLVLSSELKIKNWPWWL